MKIKDVLKKSKNIISIAKVEDVLINKENASKRGNVSLTKDAEGVHLAAYINLKNTVKENTWVMKIPNEYIPSKNIETYGYVACGQKFPVLIETDGFVYVKQKFETNIIAILDLFWLV